MHKIFVENATISLYYQIPQIIYSSLITIVINTILKQFALSEKNILAIKQEENLKEMQKYSIKMKNCITLKFIIFFILNYLFLAFFWYFISCFCGIYINTQIILIRDTFISFCFSMFYQLAYSLFPGFFRIPALREGKKDKELLYKIGKILALI